MIKKGVVIILVFLSMLYAVSATAPVPLCKVEGIIESVYYTDAGQLDCIETGVTCPAGSPTPTSWPESYKVEVKIDSSSYIDGPTEYVTCEEYYKKGKQSDLNILADLVKEGDVFKIGEWIKGIAQPYYGFNEYDLEFPPSPTCDVTGTIESVTYRRGRGGMFCEFEGCPTGLQTIFPPSYSLQVKIDSTAYVSGPTDYTTCEEFYNIGEQKVFNINVDSVNKKYDFEIGQKIKGNAVPHTSFESYKLGEEINCEPNCNIPQVQTIVNGNTVTFDIQGTPPFMINIRGNENIGAPGGYLWTKINTNTFTYDMSFASTTSNNFYYGVSHPMEGVNSWSDTQTLSLGTSVNETPLEFALSIVESFFNNDCRTFYDTLTNPFYSLGADIEIFKHPEMVSGACDSNFYDTGNRTFQDYLDTYEPRILNYAEYYSESPGLFDFLTKLNAGENDYLFIGRETKPGQEDFISEELALFMVRRINGKWKISALLG